MLNDLAYNVPSYPVLCTEDTLFLTHTHTHTNIEKLTELSNNTMQYFLFKFVIQDCVMKIYNIIIINNNNNNIDNNNNINNINIEGIYN